MKKFWSKFKIFWRELGNFLTNLLCPILSILCSAAELLHLPDSVIKALKKAEHWAFYACGTKEIIDSLVDSTDKRLEDGELDKEEVKDTISEAVEVGKEIAEQFEENKKREN